MRDGQDGWKSIFGEASESVPRRITVVGAGYVGLVSAACFAELGHQVNCLEINPRRLVMLTVGELPFCEPGLEELVAEHRASGRLAFSNDYSAAIPASEFVFLAVDTPMSEEGHADVSAVFTATRSVLEFAGPGLILVLKSTVPPGTCDAVAAFAEAEGTALRVVSNPEFLRQGTAVRDFLDPDRVVVGSTEEAVAGEVAALYDALKAPVVLCDRRSAELAKYASNAFLAARVSFMNEIAGICDAVGADIDDVAEIVGLDPRIGRRYLKAGLGWGGSCLPKDVSALRALAASLETETPLLDATTLVNENQRLLAMRKLSDALGGLNGRTIAVLGLAFKADTDDIRGAPALEAIRELLRAGANVRAHDPLAMPATAALLPDVDSCEDVYAMLAGCDGVLLATEWPAYVQLDWARVRELMTGRHIMDGRNVLDRELLGSLGFIYDSFGRAPFQESEATNLQFAVETN